MKQFFPVAYAICIRHFQSKKVNASFIFSWNHAFKNQITTLQGQAKNRANPNRSEVQANLSLFLEAASGFYTQVSCTK